MCVCPNLNALFRLVVPIVGLVSLWPPYLCPLSVGYLFVTLRQPAKNALFAVDINFGFTFTRRSIIVFCFSHSFIIIFFFEISPCPRKRSEPVSAIPSAQLPSCPVASSEFPTRSSQFVYQLLCCVLLCDRCLPFIFGIARFYAVCAGPLNTRQ